MSKKLRVFAQPVQGPGTDFMPGRLGHGGGGVTTGRAPITLPPPFNPKDNRVTRSHPEANKVSHSKIPTKKLWNLLISYISYPVTSKSVWY